MSDDVTPSVEPSAAHVSVVRGTPDDVELAALVAGLVAAAGRDEAPPPPAVSPWSDRSRRLQGPGPTGVMGQRGADTWRWSLR